MYTMSPTTEGELGGQIEDAISPRTGMYDRCLNRSQAKLSRETDLFNADG